MRSCPVALRWRRRAGGASGAAATARTSRGARSCSKDATASIRGLAHAPAPRHAIEQHVGQRHDGHALVVRHVGRNRREPCRTALPGRCEIERLHESERVRAPSPATAAVVRQGAQWRDLGRQSRWHNRPPPTRRPGYGAMPGAAHPAPCTGRPGCSRWRHRRTPKCPREYPAGARGRSAPAAPPRRHRATRCPTVRRAPAWASGIRTSTPTRSADRPVCAGQKTAVPARPNGAPARRRGQSPPGWSGVTPMPAGHRSQRPACCSPTR
jgi:hypothetical protein